MNSSEYPSTEMVPTQALSRMVTGEITGVLPTLDPALSGVEQPESQDGLSRYLHALRRRWLMASVIGAPLAIVVGLTLWSLMPENYTARSTLEVAAAERPFMFNTGDQKALGGDYDSYKRTQRLWLRSPFVIARALDNPKAAAAAVLRDKKDPIAWIETNLNVALPEDTQVMYVSLSAPAPQGLDDLVNAIVDAYFHAIVSETRDARNKRLSDLQKVLQDKDNELRGKRNDLKSLVQKVGSGDSGNLSIIQENYLHKYKTFQSYKAQVELRLMQARRELQRFESNATLSDAELQELIPETDIAKITAGDRTIQNLENQRKVDEAYINQTRTSLRNNPELAEERVRRYVMNMNSIDAKLDERRKDIGREVIEARRRVDTSQVKILKQSIDDMNAEQKALQEELDQLNVHSARVGTSSVEVEMLRFEIESLADVRKGLAAEYERMKVELKPDSSPKDGRIRVRWEARGASPPDPVPRIRNAAVGSFFSLGLPFVLLVWLDARKNRIHTATQVTQGVRLSVIGSVPVIPRRVMRRLNGPSKREQYWRTLLSESVDAIAAVVIRNAPPGASRVIMVSSASAGEGKTTLAGQLAVSLASAGRATILVDFDLRRPTLHRVFGLSLSPGIKEVLRGETDLESAVQPTLVPNLTVLSAGRSNQNGLASLAGTDLKLLFERLRAGFAFVVVDASPILPVVDTRLIGQHVDAVLLSVLRDVSRVPKVRAACQFLELFGIPILGAVMAGSSEEAYTDSHYESLPETHTV